MSAIINQSSERVVYLTIDGYPATGLDHTNVNCFITKAGGTTRVAKALTTLNFKSLDFGYYKVIFTAADMNTLGDFVFYLDPADIDAPAFQAGVFEQFTVIQPPPTPATVGTCVVSGRIQTFGLTTPSDIKITARAVAFPAKTGSGILLTGDTIWTRPDAYGNFTLGLARNAIMMFEVERAGIRAQITIPDADTANIVDLLPNIVNNY